MKVVAPLPGKTFGARVDGIDLANVSPEQFDELARAFKQHGLCVLQTVAGHKPEHEVALYRRLEQLWNSTPSRRPPERPRAEDANLRGANPPGWPEIGLLGYGNFGDHFGLEGWLLPTPWWEKAGLQWHHDGSFDGVAINVSTWMSCHETPPPSTHTTRWVDAGGLAHELQTRSGATLFASCADAYDSCSAAERRRLEGLRVRYWSNPSGFGRVEPGVYPKMSPCGTRVMEPPPARDSSSAAATYRSGTAAMYRGESEQAPAVDGFASDLGGDLGGPGKVLGDGGFVQPLIQVHPDTGRRCVFCHTLNMMRLESAHGGQVLSWEDSQALISRVFQRVTTPARALQHAWKPGQIVFWDNRCMLHSVTPTDHYTEQGGRRLMHRISLESDYIPERPTSRL
jgi:alpha-ketoglutarate-dependent taurine dioxygenase